MGHFPRLNNGLRLAMGYDRRMKKNDTRHSLEKIKSLIRYDAEEGRFYWVADHGKNIRVGMRAGGVRGGRGYEYVSILGENFTAAQLAWFLYYGQRADGRLSYKDGDNRNVAIANLLKHRGIKGYDTRTSEGRAAYAKAWRIANPERFREKSLLKSFGIGLAEYGDMMVVQNGKCAICKTKETGQRLGKTLALAVDHNHTTGEVRGLLCRNCNTLIGHAKEDRERLLSAIEYLDKYNGETKAVPSLTLIKGSA